MQTPLDQSNLDEDEGRLAIAVSEAGEFINSLEESHYLDFDGGEQLERASIITSLSERIANCMSRRVPSPASTNSTRTSEGVLREAFQLLHAISDAGYLRPKLTSDEKLYAQLEQWCDHHRPPTYGGLLSSEGDKREAEPTSEPLEIHVVANDPVARELIKRGIKWIDRLNERKNLIPHFFDNDTDPAPLARDMRRYLSQPAVPNIAPQ